MKPDLVEAIAAAQSADRLTRIDWRTPIAQHGAEAIDAVAPWIRDPELGAFAVRVVEAAAGFGAREEALEALRGVGRLGPSEAVLRDIDAALARLDPHARANPGAGSARVRLRAKDGWDWPGFAPTDFGQVVGTTWRRRSDPISMLPLVLRPLLDIDADFSTWPLWGMPEVHIAVRDRYEQGGERWQGWRASKLVIYANGPTPTRQERPAHVVVGWYIEKGDGSPRFGPVNRELWDWPRFLELPADPRRRAILEAAMAAHDLRIGDYIGGSFSGTGALVGFRARLEAGELVIRSTVQDEGVIGRGWEALLELLAGLDIAAWHCLHVWTEWPAADAIAMGQPFALRVIEPVLTALARVYLETVWPGGRRTA